MDDLNIDNDVFEVKYKGEKLGGINQLQSEDKIAIPYYTWSNRGVGKMKVWLKNNMKK